MYNAEVRVSHDNLRIAPLVHLVEVRIELTMEVDIDATFPVDKGSQTRPVHFRRLRSGGLRAHCTLPSKDSDKFFSNAAIPARTRSSADPAVARRNIGLSAAVRCVSPGLSGGSVMCRTGEPGSLRLGSRTGVPWRASSDRTFCSASFRAASMRALTPA